MHIKCFFLGHNFLNNDENILFCSHCGIQKPISCTHKWKILKIEKLYSYSQVIGFTHNLQCEKCGEVKSKTFNLYNKRGDFLEQDIL